MDTWRLVIDESYPGQIVDTIRDTALIRRIIRSKQDRYLPNDDDLSVDAQTDRTAARCIYGQQAA